MKVYLFFSPLSICFFTEVDHKVIWYTIISLSKNQKMALVYRCFIKKTGWSITGPLMLPTFRSDLFSQNLFFVFVKINRFIVQLKIKHFCYHLWSKSAIILQSLNWKKGTTFMKLVWDYNLICKNSLQMGCLCQPGYFDIKTDWVIRCESSRSDKHSVIVGSQDLKNGKSKWAMS